MVPDASAVGMQKAGNEAVRNLFQQPDSIREESLLGKEHCSPITAFITPECHI